MSYQKLLLTAREQAELRLQEKGLGSEKRQFKFKLDPKKMDTTPADSGQPLISRPAKQTEVEDDFMTSYFNKLYEQNRELKEELRKQNLGDVTPEDDLRDQAREMFDGEENTDSPYFNVKDMKSTDIGVRLKQDIQEIFGLEDHQAAAIAGNLDHETGAFKFMQELNPMVKGSKGGYGFAQWTGDRRVAFENWAKQNGMDPSSYDANLGFLVHEFQTDDYFKKIMGRLEKTTTVDEATKVFSDGYLKPGIPKMDLRLKKSRGYVGK
jgi:hypothetical protein